jgi:chromosome segregation ATPase
MDMIDDLQAEKRLLEEEQERLLSSQFGREREAELQREIDDLRSRLSDNTRDLASHLDQKSGMQSQLQQLKERLKELAREKQESDKRALEIQEELDDLREKFKFFTKGGEIDLSEIEEALAFVRLRRERGISLDFLYEAEELYAVNSSVR